MGCRNTNPANQKKPGYDALPLPETIIFAKTHSGTHFRSSSRAARTSGGQRAPAGWLK